MGLVVLLMTLEITAHDGISKNFSHYNFVIFPAGGSKHGIVPDHMVGLEHVIVHGRKRFFAFTGKPFLKLLTRFLPHP